MILNYCVLPAVIFENYSHLCELQQKVICIAENAFLAAQFFLVISQEAQKKTRTLAKFKCSKIYNRVSWQVLNPRFHKSSNHKPYIGCPNKFGLFTKKYQFFILNKSYFMKNFDLLAKNLRFGRFQTLTRFELRV